MKTKLFFALSFVLAGLWEMPSRGDDLFRVTFRAVCFPSGNTNKITKRVSGTGLIRRCLGDDVSERAIRRRFALVYNATADSLQVVNRPDGTPVCDVFRFETAASTVASNRLERLAFVLRAEDGQFIGSAVFTERPVTNTTSGTLRARITARLQFFENRTGTTNSNSQTNVVTSPGTNQPTQTTNAPTGNQPAGGVSIGSFAQTGAFANASEAIQVCTATFVGGRILGSSQSSDADTTSGSPAETTPAPPATNSPPIISTNQPVLSTNINTTPTNISTIPPPPTPF